jgi:hypothetical protein
MKVSEFTGVPDVVRDFLHALYAVHKDAIGSFSYDATMSPGSPDPVTVRVVIVESDPAVFSNNVGLLERWSRKHCPELGPLKLVFRAQAEFNGPEKHAWLLP